MSQPATRPRKWRQLPGKVAAAALLAAACSAEEYVRAADREVADVLASKSEATLGTRAADVERPQPEAVEDPALPTPAAGEPEPPTTLDLTSALATAFAHSREYVDRQEGLYLQGLGLTLTRFRFGPQLSATVASVWRDAEDGGTSYDHGADFGLSQILPTGGVLGADAGLANAWTTSADSYSSDVGFSLRQPLLRGAGYEVSHEALTQAERDLVYAVRSFELFRQDFAIDIAQGYFDLVRQRRQLANDEQSWRDAVFDREKAEALRQVDRNRDEDVFLARRREINSETDLLSARADRELSVDSFRIRLGLPEGTALHVGDEEPPFERVRLDADSAVAVALHNRLDLQSERERLQDSERAAHIARDGLRAQVDLELAWGLGDSGSNPSAAWADHWSHSAGLRVEVPLQRTPERNAYRAALVDLERTRRDLEVLFERTERDVRDALRQLLRTEQQITLQEQQILQEQRAVAVTELRFEAGEAEARDLLDARQSLLDAENSLINLKIEHFIGRLGLYRELGVLFIAEDGSWSRA